MTDRELVAKAITASGLSARRFAVLVMAGRDERTIRRWQAGHGAIPPGARDRLSWFLAQSEPFRARLVRALVRGG